MNPNFLIGKSQIYMWGVILVVSLTLLIGIVSSEEVVENKELLNCLCRCLEPPGGQFSCAYDTEDMGWSPSCRDLSNGPCICKAYGCFRGPLPAEGECYERCYEQACKDYCKVKYGQEGGEAYGEGKWPDCTCVIDYKDEYGRLTRTEKISGVRKDIYIFDPLTGELIERKRGWEEEEKPQRYIDPGNVENLKKFLRSLGYSERHCPKEGNPPPGSVKFWNNNAHTSVVVHDNRQIEMGHKPGGSKYESEILPPGENPRPNVGTYVLTEMLCPPPGSSFDIDRAKDMEGIDREIDNPQTKWNCHGFSANVVYECVQTWLRVKPGANYNFDGTTLKLQKGAIYGNKARIIGIPQGQVRTYSQYTIEVKDDQTTVIQVIEGKADYQGGGHSLSLSSGLMAVIDPTGVSSAPTAFDINKMDQWWERIEISPETSQEKEGLIFESRSKSSGSSVQIPLTLKGSTDKIGNMDLTLSYDPLVLEAKEVIKGGLTANSLFDYNIPGKGTIKISLADKEGFSGDGSVAQVVFNVIGVEGSSSPLRIVSLSANRAEDLAAMSISTQDGLFKVIGVEECRGDCNGDGNITALDALCALQMSVGKKTEELVMDVNEDGSVTSLDARKILRSAAGIEVT